jgi:hypothetical protein
MLSDKTLLDYMERVAKVNHHESPLEFFDRRRYQRIQLIPSSKHLEHFGAVLNGNPTAANTVAANTTTSNNNNNNYNHNSNQDSDHYAVDDVSLLQWLKNAGIADSMQMYYSSDCSSDVTRTARQPVFKALNSEEIKLCSTAIELRPVPRVCYLRGKSSYLGFVLPLSSVRFQPSHLVLTFGDYSDSPVNWVCEALTDVSKLTTPLNLNSEWSVTNQDNWAKAFAKFTDFELDCPGWTPLYSITNAIEPTFTAGLQTKIFTLPLAPALIQASQQQAQQLGTETRNVESIPKYFCFRLRPLSASHPLGHDNPRYYLTVSNMDFYGSVYVCDRAVLNCAWTHKKASLLKKTAKLIKKGMKPAAVPLPQAAMEDIDEGENDDVSDDNDNE